MKLSELLNWAEPKVDAGLLWLVDRPWTSVAIVAFLLAAMLFGLWVS